MKALIIGFLLAFALTSQSEAKDTITISFVPPITKADGTPLIGSDIKLYIVKWGKKGGPYTLGQMNILPPKLSQTTPALDDGEYCFVMVTQVQDGTNSDFSFPEACAIAKTPSVAANPPSGVNAK